MVKNPNNEDSFEIVAKVPQHPVGWFESTLPNDAMNRLHSYIESAKKNPINVNKELAGNISQSLDLEDTDDWFLKTILHKFISKFKLTWPEYTSSTDMLTIDVPYCVDTFWVNFQKETEFNPTHNHTGIYSFVVWVKIPTDWREQHALPISANSNSASASDFKFYYNTLLGGISGFRYLLDKNSEGMMLFFPSQLNHIVYPFYNCDEERISISGNIRLDTSENSIKQYRQRRGEFYV